MRGEGLSASDVALLQGRNNDNNDGGFGGNNGWWIVLILLFAFRGFDGNRGNNGGGSGDSTSSLLPYLLAKDSSNSVQPNYVLTSDFAQIDRKLDGIANGICDSTFALNNTITNGFSNVQQTLCQGFGGVNQAITTNGYETRLGVQGLAAQLAGCCCDLKEGISGVNYNLSQIGCGITNTINMSTRDLIDNQNANYRALHDEIVANRIEDKNAQIQAQQNEINALRLAASQERQNNYLVDQLRPCPIPAYITCNPFASCNCGYGYNSCGCN